MSGRAAILALLLCPALGLAAPCDTPRFGAPAVLDEDQPGYFGTIVTGDFDGDGIPDVAFSAGSVHVVVLFLSPDGTVARRSTLPPAAALTAGDLNRDGIDDLVVGRDVWLGSRSREFTLAASAEGPVEALVDWDGDGWLDGVAITASPTNSLESVLQVFRNDGTGRLTLAWTIDIPTALPEHLVAGDFDRDGKGDVAVAGFGRFDVLYGNGAGGIEHAWSGGVGGSLNALREADLDGDGNVDFVVVGCGGFYSCMGPMLDVYWGDGHRSFTSSFVQTLWYGFLTDVAVADFNGDGRLDLAVSGTEGLGVFLGAGAARSFATASPVARGGPPIAALDVFSNGAPDILFSGDGLQVLPNSCGAGAAEAVLLVPFVLDADGAGPTRYSSRLAVANTGLSPSVDVALDYHSALGGPIATGHLHLQSLRQLELPALELLARAGIPVSPLGDGGTLRLRFTGLTAPGDALAWVLVTSTPASGPPTRVFYPAVPVSRAFTGAASLPWLRETAAERTNLALSNAGATSDGAVTLRVTLTPDAASAGAPVTIDVALAPGDFHQLASVFAPYGWPGGFARVERLSGTAPWLAWAVVHDRATGDASFLPARAPETGSGDRTSFAPAIVDSDRYASDVWLANAADAPVTLSWSLAGIPLPPLTLARGEQREIRDFVAVSRAGGTPLPAPLVAPLVTQASQALFVAARVRSRSSGAGVLVPATSETAFEALVPLPSTPGYANLGILSLSNETAIFHVELFDGAAGASAGNFDVSIAPGEIRQLADVTRAPVPIVSGWARISWLARRYGPFIAYGVSMEGEGPGAGGDGAWVPMFVTK